MARRRVATLSSSLSSSSPITSSSSTTRLCFDSLRTKRRNYYNNVVFFSTAFNKKKRKYKDPFIVLGVSSKSDYKTVKRAFLKIAMDNHPDTAEVSTEQEKDILKDVFMKARAAFERVLEMPDGSCALKEDIEEHGGGNMSKEDFNNWFKRETGTVNPFQFDLDPEIMLEVAEMTEKVQHGLDRDGGMWHLATLVSQSVKEGKGGAQSLLKLEAGDLVNEQQGSSGSGSGKRRRRKR